METILDTEPCEQKLNSILHQINKSSIIYKERTKNAEKITNLYHDLIAKRAALEARIAFEQNKLTTIENVSQDAQIAANLYEKIQRQFVAVVKREACYSFAYQRKPLISKLKRMSGITNLVENARWNLLVNEMKSILMRKQDKLTLLRRQTFCLDDDNSTTLHQFRRRSEVTVVRHVNKRLRELIASMVPKSEGIENYRLKTLKFYEYTNTDSDTLVSARANLIDQFAHKPQVRGVTIGKLLLDKAIRTLENSQEVITKVAETVKSQTGLSRDLIKDQTRIIRQMHTLTQCIRRLINRLSDGVRLSSIAYFGYRKAKPLIISKIPMKQIQQCEELIAQLHQPSDNAGELEALSRLIDNMNEEIKGLLECSKPLSVNFTESESETLPIDAVQELIDRQNKDLENLTSLVTQLSDHTSRLDCSFDEELVTAPRLRLPALIPMPKPSEAVDEKPLNLPERMKPPEKQVFTTERTKLVREPLSQTINSWRDSLLQEVGLNDLEQLISEKRKLGIQVNWMDAFIEHRNCRSALQKVRTSITTLRKRLSIRREKNNCLKEQTLLEQKLLELNSEIEKLQKKFDS